MSIKNHNKSIIYEAEGRRVRVSLVTREVTEATIQFESAAPGGWEPAFIGQAIKNPTDESDPQHGAAVALARAFAKRYKTVNQLLGEEPTYEAVEVEAEFTADRIGEILQQFAGEEEDREERR